MKIMTQHSSLQPTRGKRNNCIWEKEEGWRNGKKFKPKEEVPTHARKKQQTNKHNRRKRGEN